MMYGMDGNNLLLWVLLSNLWKKDYDRLFNRKQK